MKFRLVVSFLALAVGLGAPCKAWSQVGSTTDIIMGQVLGPDSLPVSGARIEATSQGVLTPEQWARVPGSIKNPFQQRDGQGDGERRGFQNPD